MGIRDKLRSTRNSVDFALRKAIRFGFPVRHALPADLQFQTAMAEFFSRFAWQEYVSPSSAIFKVLDVGARNFCLAPVLSRHFTQLGRPTEVHGIEIDAYRRLSNFRTRHDYADYFVKQTAGSHFHAVDFLQWETPADCIFALNPFVTPGPLLAWGLPLHLLRPEEFFQKAAALLPPARGLLMVTNPTPEEVALTQTLLRPQFELLEEREWFSQRGGHPRYGGLYRRLREREPSL